MRAHRLWDLGMHEYRNDVTIGKIDLSEVLKNYLYIYSHVRRSQGLDVEECSQTNFLPIMIQKMSGDRGVTNIISPLVKRYHVNTDNRATDYFTQQFSSA